MSLQLDGTIGVIGPVNEGFVTATGSTTARNLDDRFADVVNVKDFGAVGDGVEDDTEAFKNALNTGFDVFVPCMTNEIYIIGSPLTMQTRGQRLFGNQINGKTSSGTARGFIKFINDRGGVGGVPCISVTAQQVYIDGITFRGNNRIVEPNTCIGFAKTVNTDDMDGHVSSCNFIDFENAVVHIGRGLRFTMNNVSLCRYGVIHDWPTTGVDPTAPEQDLPFGDRALEITNNRFHVINQYSIYSKSPILRGALISSNVNDLGEGFLQADGDIVQSIITNNVTEGSQATCIRTFGDVISVTISNNVFAGTPSGLGMDTQNPPSAFNATGTKSVENLIFSGNIVSDTNLDGVLFGSGMTIQGLSIIGNTFKNIGKDGSAIRACIRSASSIDGASIIGNSFYPNDAPYAFRTLSSAETLKNVKAELNNYTASGGFNNGSFTDGGGNEIQS
jgi:hypothetical protein